MNNEKMGDLDNQTKSSFNEQSISYTDIANKLIKDKLLLTALELHSELVECGKEVPKLKEFFSNPGNFENQFSRSDYYGIQRSSSQATLDSLDLTRYSEDGERGIDERVAVLEFELRKAKETIQALRANLTVATECETPTAENAEPLQVEPIKPHEQRALNYLINEYLLRHQYKLTSITFADENGDQDFEDWDDVGLNIPKPAELLQLYRDAMRQPAHSPPTPTTHWGGQTDLPDPQSLLLAAELEKLREQVSNLEREKADYLSRIERLSTIEPVTTHFAAGDTEPEPEPETVSVHSATPERFEVIERDAAARPDSESGSGERGDDNSSLNEWTRLNESETGSTVGMAVSEREEPAGAEDPPIQLPPPTPSSQVRSLPAGFQREVLSRCLINTRVAESSLLEELLSQTDSVTRLTHSLATSLPRLIPLITRREELIPLLVCTVQLLRDSGQRDTLLQALFSLRKRPQIDERRAILAGLVWLARACGPAVIEGELLPLCWEQMSHKHREHRLLVAEACSALAPYISAGLRNSLLLSILQQLLTEDREDVVRLSCVNSLALITAVMMDTDKYSQCEELTLAALQDSSLLVTEAALNTLLPVLGQWAAGLGWLGEKLLTRLVNTLHTSCKPGEGRWARALSLVHSIRSLLPFLVISVASVDIVTSKIQPGLPPAESRAGFAELCQGLTNPAMFYDGEFTVGSVMSAFDLTVKDTQWPELDWVVEVMLPKMMDVLERVDVTNEELLNSFVLFFKSFAAGFGKTVTVNMLKPLFVCRLQALEKSLVSLSSDWPSLSVIPVYLLAVLAPLQSEEEEVGQTLQRFTVSLALSRAPVDCLQLSISRLSRQPPLLETIMAALWTGVVHPRPAVRALTADLFGHAVPHAGESMTTNRIVPALITLASDQEITVKTATIPVFGKLVEHSTNKEVCDKTYFQLQSLLGDAAARDSHAAVLQLVATLGTIVSKCDQWFRDDVVVPWLAATAATTLQSTNQSRRLDLAAALVKAFNNVVYCELTNATVTTALLPGLRYLEQICSQCLEGQRETVVSMIQEVESRVETPVKPMERSSSTITLAMATSNVGQGVEDMKNRVTKIFQTPISRPTNLPNLQSINIFRKK